MPDGGGNEIGRRNGKKKELTGPKRYKQNRKGKPRQERGQGRAKAKQGREVRRVKAWKTDEAVMQEKHKKRKMQRTNGWRKHEVSEERTENLGRREERARKQVGPDGNMGSGMRKRKWRHVVSTKGKQSRRMKFRENRDGVEGQRWKAARPGERKPGRCIAERGTKGTED